MLIKVHLLPVYTSFNWRPGYSKLSRDLLGTHLVTCDRVLKHVPGSVVGDPGVILAIGKAT